MRICFRLRAEILGLRLLEVSDRGGPRRSQGKNVGAYLISVGSRGYMMRRLRPKVIRE